MHSLDFSSCVFRTVIGLLQVPVHHPFRLGESRGNRLISYLDSWYMGSYFLGLFLCLGGEEAAVPCDASPAPALVSAAPVSALFQGVLVVV